MDHLGLALFSVAIQSSLNFCDFPQVVILAYLDDIIILGLQEPTLHAFHDLKLSLAVAGLMVCANLGSIQKFAFQLHNS